MSAKSSAASLPPSPSVPPKPQASAPSSPAPSRESSPLPSSNSPQPSPAFLAARAAIAEIPHALVGRHVVESLFLAGLPTIESVHRNIPYASYYPLIAPFFDHPSLIASYEFFVAPFNTDPKFGALTLITFAGLLYATIGILPPAAPSPSA